MIAIESYDNAMLGQTEKLSSSEPKKLPGYSTDGNCGSAGLVDPMILALMAMSSGRYQVRRRRPPANNFAPCSIRDSGLRD